MRLLALSDLHLGHPENARAIADLPAFPDDWLIVAGDVGETEDHLRRAWELLVPRFARVVWVPGNHELYTTPRDPCQLRGEARYPHLVDVCRAWGVITPEDPFVAFPGAATPTLLAPIAPESRPAMQCCSPDDEARPFDAGPHAGRRERACSGSRGGEDGGSANKAIQEHVLRAHLPAACGGRPAWL